MIGLVPSETSRNGLTVIGGHKVIGTATSFAPARNAAIEETILRED